MLSLHGYREQWWWQVPFWLWLRSGNNLLYPIQEPKTDFNYGITYNIKPGNCLTSLLLDIYLNLYTKTNKQTNKQNPKQSKEKKMCACKGLGFQHKQLLTSSFRVNAWWISNCSEGLHKTGVSQSNRLCISEQIAMAKASIFVEQLLACMYETSWCKIYLIYTFPKRR